MDTAPENPANLHLLEMRPEEAANGLRLSRLAHWNQTLGDWDFLLREGSGIGFRTEAGLWVATLVALPLGADIGWLSMVLVDPEWRRQGLASRLMQEGVRWLRSRGLRPVLDATPDGETVYRNLGFSGQVNLARWLLTPEPGRVWQGDGPGPVIRPVTEADLDRLAQWDREVSGHDRRAVLRHLYRYQPGLAFLAEDKGGEMLGLVMGRGGVRATHLGPLVARDAAVAQALVLSAMKAIESPFYVDAFSANQPALAAGLGIRWSKERTFRRMAFGDAPLPGTPDLQYLAAGPELG